MNIIENLLITVFFLSTSALLIAIGIALYLDYRDENKGVAPVFDSHEEHVKAHIELTTGPFVEAPEIFEHSYDLQLLYLAREGALSQFEENYKNDDLSLFFAQCEPSIASAFNWNGTPEGLEYWNKLRNGYENFLKGQE